MAFDECSPRTDFTMSPRTILILEDNDERSAVFQSGVEALVPQRNCVSLCPARAALLEFLHCLPRSRCGLELNGVHEELFAF